MLKATQLEDIMILKRKALTFSQSHSQAHCLVAQADTQPKPAKKLVLFKQGLMIMNKARNANTRS